MRPEMRLPHAVTISAGPPLPDLGRNPFSADNTLSLPAAPALAPGDLEGTVELVEIIEQTTCAQTAPSTGSLPSLGSLPPLAGAGVIGGTERTAASTAPFDSSRPPGGTALTGAGALTRADDEEDVVLSIPDAVRPGPERAGRGGGVGRVGGLPVKETTLRGVTGACATSRGF